MFSLKLIITRHTCCFFYCFIIFLLVLKHQGQGQAPTAFMDYRDYFVVFQYGQFNAIEHLPVKSFQMGGECIAYLDNTEAFKVAYQSEVFTLSENITSYKATDSFVWYVFYDQLKVFDRGEDIVLSPMTEQYSVGDRIAAFVDENMNLFRIYENGKFRYEEDENVGSGIRGIKTGDNICCFINRENYLVIYYGGQIYEIFYVDRQVQYSADKNIAAYVDYRDNSFHCFYKGFTTELEQFAPLSFRVGDDLVAYVSNTGDFKVFNNGEMTTVNSFEPDFYAVKDSVVVFGYEGYFYTYWNNSTIQLENYIPDNYQIDNSSISYIDLSGALKVVENGATKIVTYEQIREFVLNSDVLLYQVGIREFKVYYNNEIYTLHD